jgi:Zn-dependent M28 family amino/carboxypeptidase
MSIHPPARDRGVPPTHRVRAVIALLAVLGALAPSLAGAATPADSAALREAVTPEAILVHEQALQEIADANGDTRTSGSPGYDASLLYVKGLLDATGYYTTAVQTFDFDFFQELAPTTFERVSPDPEVYTAADDFEIMDYSGSGDVTGALVPTNDIQVPPGAEASSSTSGCEPEDFTPASTTEVQVALVQRGTCDFVVKAENAETAGYDAVVIMNEGQEGRQDTLLGTLGGVGVTVPVIGTSFAVGEELYALTQAGEVVVHVVTSTQSETRTTANLIADTKTGRTDRVVVVGAHLDSVPEGPGINDNGSGSSAILEAALQMAELDMQPRNQVRFAWWGAEESGLVGSQHYVDSLTARQRKDIAVNLNFDMVGSPNYVRFVYDGDASDTESLGSTGSGVVEDVFVDYFDSQGLESEPTAFDGRSDYDAFISAGIPAGGLFTGAEGIKTPEEAAIYGGTAGQAYDPCYHQACDDIDNLSFQALDEMSDAIAHGIVAFAETTSAIQGTAKGHGGTGGSGDFRGSHLRR